MFSGAIGKKAKDGCRIKSGMTKVDRCRIRFGWTNKKSPLLAGSVHGAGR
jgi:hypothetical protein